MNNTTKINDEKEMISLGKFLVICSETLEIPERFSDSMPAYEGSLKYTKYQEIMEKLMLLFLFVFENTSPKALQFAMRWHLGHSNKFPMPSDLIAILEKYWDEDMERL